MNILGLISQLIGIKTLRLTIYIKERSSNYFFKNNTSRIEEKNYYKNDNERFFIYW